MNTQLHPLARFGHYIVLSLAALAWVLDREHVITDQVHGTIQVAMAVLGAGKVAAFFHNAQVVKAQTFLQEQAARADQAGETMKQLGALVQGIVAEARQAAADTTPKGATS